MAKQTQSMKRSRFASLLADLLDGTELFSRDEWSRFLSVSEPAISQWVNDKTVPRADVLKTILDVLRNSSGIPVEILQRFDELALQPATDVSPLGHRMKPNVAEYMRSSSLVQLGRDLGRLSPTQQIAALTDGSWPPPNQIRTESPAYVGLISPQQRRQFAEAVQRNRRVFRTRREVEAAHA